jgi:hypothetical protein
VSDDKLTPKRAARLLRAKAGQMEHWVLHNANRGDPDALVAQLLADHIERAA